MSDKQRENRVNIEDLPKAEQELTPEEAKEVQGGLKVKLEDVLISGYQSSGSEGSSVLPSGSAKGGDDILIGGPTTVK